MSSSILYGFPITRATLLPTLSLASFPPQPCLHLRPLPARHNLKHPVILSPPPPPPPFLVIAPTLPLQHRSRMHQIHHHQRHHHWQGIQTLLICLVCQYRIRRLRPPSKLDQPEHHSHLPPRQQPPSTGKQKHSQQSTPQPLQHPTQPPSPSVPQPPPLASSGGTSLLQNKTPPRKPTAPRSQPCTPSALSSRAFYQKRRPWPSSRRRRPG